MAYSHRPIAAAVVGRSLYAILAAFPIACFTLTLATDIAFWRTSNLMWQYFSAWLLCAGLVFGVLAALVRLFDFILRREVRAIGAAWAHAIVGAVVLILAIVNSFVHAGDGWTAVVPYGLALSAVTVVLMLVAAVLRRAMVSRAFEMGNVYG
ncbi:DUF2231 domain-containing protein [Aureimonas leprariae]|uniref:DUF2231 domain-containing protein n=1 Tax=Plantimonas leprariae TaxID=2615207 RepID=A0A7V7TXU6_9HYPH|nr:DUF2231 domain-containing protein [Aureimonas leprariae]KAB0682104.1 DUF2231 domain-containing protein [Aureimonas leprariae]